MRAADVAVLNQGSEVCRSYEFMPSVRPGPIPKIARCFAFYFADSPSSKHERVDINNSHAAERKLAKQYGLEGFCYYTNGLANERRRNLLNSIVAVDDQFGFCLCWTGAHQLEENSQPRHSVVTTEKNDLSSIFWSKSCLFCNTRIICGLTGVRY